VLSTKAVFVANTVPPVDVKYHLILVPVADKLNTDGVTYAQNFCGVVPVGADGATFTVIFLVAVVVPHKPPLVVKVKVIEPDSEALA